jgi:hypothetical protein
MDLVALLSRVPLPEFGGEGVDGWLEEVEKRLSRQGTAEAVWPGLAAAYLVGYARATYQHEDGRDWMAFKAEMRRLFRPTRYAEQVFTELGALKCGSSVGALMEYFTKFQSLVRRAELQEAGLLLGVFLKGLPQPVAAYVRLHVRPTTVSGAFEGAKFCMETVGAMGLLMPGASGLPAVGAGAVPMELDALKDVRGFKPAAPECWVCGVRGHIARNCSKRVWPGRGRGGRAAGRGFQRGRVNVLRESQAPPLNEVGEPVEEGAGCPMW